MACQCVDRHAIVDLLNTYAACLDTRDWPVLNNVFHQQATGIYGVTLDGRAAIVASIRGFLDGCGPSQHLLGNYQISIEGDHAESSTNARVLHLGTGKQAALKPYEAIGVYRDRYVRTDEGWRIIHRHFDVHITLGDINVLQPA
jgi:3-phenylpropionate/cinnamic acid dioxygenase small subunit